MMEVYLYKCERCGGAKFAEEDHGNVWYQDGCGGCRDWAFFHKVVSKILDDGTKMRVMFEELSGSTEEDDTTKKE